MPDSLQPQWTVVHQASVYGIFQAWIREWVAISSHPKTHLQKHAKCLITYLGSRAQKSWHTKLMVNWVNHLNYNLKKKVHEQLDKNHLFIFWVFNGTANSYNSKIHSVQFSHSVMSDSLWPHEPQHARPPCPSLTPGVHPNSCPSRRWCHPAISSSVVPFPSCPQSLPASGSFPMSQLFAWGGQNIVVSASASVRPMNTQDWSPLGWTDWISLQSKGLSRVFSNTTVQKHPFFSTQLSSQSNSHIHTWLQKNSSLD